MAQAFFICGFKKPWAKTPVDLKDCGDYLPRSIISVERFIHGILPPLFETLVS
jgi:hypothetical protein